MINNFSEIVHIIRQSRFDAMKSVNEHLIDLYWKVGEYVTAKINDDGWGKNTVNELSKFIQKNEQGIRGFSSQNIWRMKQFYETYNNYPKLSSLMREISWTSNLQILSKTKSIEEKEFYIKLAINEKYTVRELKRQIDSGFYERTIIAPTAQRTKLATVMRDIHPKANLYFKDTYILDFLNLPDEHSEFQLKKGIVHNLKTFLLEIGKDFTFVGEEYQLQIGKNDYYIDLLFYHRDLCCLVAFELKIDDFKPEYLGKINFYLEALDRDVKKPHENPSVGILLCKRNDVDVVEYALSRSLSPALIAEYKTKLIDKKILQDKLKEFYDISEEISEKLNEKNEIGSLE